MANDNIFSGLKVVDLASFIAGPGAAVILSDFGADVIKVEPPTGDTWRIGYKIPPQPRAKDNYPWHLNNRNKRGLALDLKSPEARDVLRRLVEWADVLIVNTPHPAREKLNLGFEDVAPWNPRLIYADVTGYGDNGPDAQLPGFDITAYWARSGLLSLTRDAGAPPTLPVAGSGDHATAGGNAPERVRTSRPRCSLPVSGLALLRPKLHLPTPNSSRCTIAPIRRTPPSMSIERLMTHGL
jgi:crotonobetainyl-CoA:carnitine CoA-transferase CaiB-like acyl-CoA transferase